MTMQERVGSSSVPRFLSTPWLLVLVGLLGLVIGIAVTLWLRQERPEPVASQDSVNTGPQRPPAIDDASPTGTAMQSPARLPETMEMQMPSQEQIARQFSRYEAAFRQDKLDPNWAPGAERTLVQAATDPSLTELGVPKEFDASCLGRLCKVTVSFETQGQAGDWAELYVLGMADAVSFVQTMRSTTADGRPQLILYGARKGSEQLLAPPATYGAGPSIPRQP